MIRFYILLLICIFFGYSEIYSQQNSFSKTPYAILDVSNASFADDSLESIFDIVKINRWGFRVQLEKVNGELVIQNRKGIHLPFAKLLEQIKEHSNNNNFTFIPFIINYPGAITDVDALISNLELEDYLVNSSLLELDNTTNWYNQNRKHIILFSELEHSRESTQVIPLKKYLNDFKDAESFFCAYVYNGFVEESEHAQFVELVMGNESTFVKQIVTDWKKKGKYPVYFLVNTYNYAFRSLSRAMESFPNASGAIAPLPADTIETFWKEFPEAITRSKFCFPIESEKDFSLTPHSPGFRYNPLMVSNQNWDQVGELKFSYNPVHLSENLKGYYKFNGSILDETLLNNGVKVYGTDFNTDNSRGQVIEFRKGDFVELPKIKFFNLADNSFSMASWVYLTEENEYQAIVCNTENKFRKGLQFAVRDQKPYVGFWHIDLKGQTTILPKKWYHLACVYNHNLQKLKIYVDGKPDAVACDFLSFIGSKNKTLYLGKNPAGHQFSGMLDELMIWDRALSDDEIEKVFSDGLSNEHFIKYWWTTETARYLAIIVIVVIIGFIAFLLAVRFKKVRALKKGDAGLDEKVKLKVYLFGSLKIVDNKGNDYSKMFTPKIRSVFLVILFNSIGENSEGINSTKLSELLWPDTSHKNAFNNRRVATKRLREVLDKIEGLKLIAEDHIYKIETGDDVYIDLGEYNKIGKQQKPESLEHIIRILSRGKFFQQIEKPWADELKNSIMNQVIEDVATLINNESVEPKEKLELADILLLNDPVDEFAIKKKIELLKQAGREKSAELAFKKFCKDYKEYFNEEYNEKLN